MNLNSRSRELRFTGYLMSDNVHIMGLSIPPKCAVSNVVGYLKGKCAIARAFTFQIARRYEPASASRIAFVR